MSPLRHRARNSGFVLLPVMFLLAMVAVVVYLVVVEGAVDVRLAEAGNEGDVAEYVAHAGLAHATWSAANTNCVGDVTIGDTPLDAHSYSASVASDETSANVRVLPAADTWVDELAPDDNHAGDTELRVRSEPGQRRIALYRFDLTGFTPGVTLSGVRLWLRVTADDPEAAVGVHPVRGAWVENTVTWHTLPAWATDTAARLPPGVGDGTWAVVDVTGLARAWINQPAGNYGLALVAESQDEESTYTTRGFGTASERPFLEVVTASGPMSPVVLTATGVHAGGAQRTLSTPATAYQGGGGLVLQPGAGGADTYVRGGGSSGDNYGGAGVVRIDTSTPRHGLIRFNLSGIAQPAHVSSAEVLLYLDDAVTLNDGVFDLHRITRAWAEGVENGAAPADPGATYTTSDGVSSWVTAGGDYDPTVVASQTIADATPGWYRWPVTELVQQWLNGQRPNFGVLLRSSGGTVDRADFVSGDGADDAHHPMLAMTVGCECGRVCAIPQGDADVVMVVGSASSPSDADVARAELFQTWGYRVTMLSDGTSQAGIDAALATQDVVYLSGSVDPATVGTKLTNTQAGVVNEVGALNDELGIASTSAVPVAADLTVADNTHYVASYFPLDNVGAYRAPMAGVAAAGSLAPGGTVLARWGSAPTLVALDEGDALQGGGNAAGRRVMVPLGEGDALDWPHVGASMRQLVQRSLQWASACNGNVRDNMVIASYGANHGTRHWTGDWQEVGEADGPFAGDVLVALDGADLGNVPQLRIEDDQNGAWRGVDLGGAGAATLNLRYRRVNLENSNKYLSIQMSRFGGSGAWTEVGRLAGPADDSSYATFAADVSAFSSPTAALRFISSDSMGGNDRVWIDQVDLTCDP